MDADRELVKLGSVVQISPETKSAFAGCFLLVTELKAWGVQGFIAMPKGMGSMPGQAYYRAKWEEIEYIGQAVWVPQDLYEESDRL